MKNKILLICGSLLLLIFLAFGTYYWYIYFLRASSVSISNGETVQNEGGITLIDNDKNVYDIDATSTDGENLDDVEAYIFNIKNDNKNKGSYTLYLEDVPINSIKDGCTEETILDRNQLNYQLILNEQVLKEDDLDNIKDNVLDSREISGNTTNHYKLKVFIKEDAENWLSKHYHYKVTLKKNR